ncbi:MAG: hypothetical protein WC608_02215 [Parcubacteria group bacterium]
MQKLKKNLPLVVIIGILFATGMVFANAFNSQKGLTRLGTPVAFGDDDDDKEDEADDKEDEDDNDRDEDENDREDEDKNDNEDENDDQDEQRTTRTGTQVRTQEADDDDDEDENEIDEDENEDADELKEDISELNEDIQKVESRINVLASNGVSVDAFRNNLNEVKGLVAQAEAQAVSNPKGAEDILESAEHKLERVEKLVKMFLKDDDEDEESVEEAIEEISELKRDIAKVETRLNLASSRGIDVSAYRTILNDVKEMLVQAEAKLSAGNYVEAESLAELADKKLDRIEDIFEDDDEDDDEDEDEDEVAREYKNEVAMFVHNLKTIGEIEGGIGQQVRVVAQGQNDSQAKVENSINDVNSRSGFAKFLIGPKYGSIAEIQTAITENQTRIKVLTDLTNQMTDPAVKMVLQDQITILNQQNANLQNFVEGSESGVSLFGWLMKMFS